MLRRTLELAQYLSIKYTERLADEGAVTSVGSRGDIPPAEFEAAYHHRLQATEAA